MWVPDGTLTSRWAPGSYTVVSALDVEETTARTRWATRY